MTDLPGSPLPSPTAPGVAPRVVCIGVAALDVLMGIDGMPPEDGRIAARDGMLAGGGPAATAAVALSRLGVPTDLVSVVGDDLAGDIILAGLARDGVGTRFVRRVPGASSALSVGLIRALPANTRSLVALAPTGATMTIDAAALAACRVASWIHVDHAGWPLVQWLRANGVQTPISVDGGNPLTPATLSDADLYVPGETELLRSTGSPDIAAALDTVTRGGGPLTIVTQGAHGSTYRGCLDPSVGDADALIRTRLQRLRGARDSQSHEAHVPSPSVDVRSTLGAGDVYHGALLAGLLGGRSIVAAMAYASTAAALSCRALDGRSAIPTHEEVVQAVHLQSHVSQDPGGIVPGMSPPTNASSETLESLASLARPTGAFAMLAMDQRVSLETMFLAAGKDASVATLDRFRGHVLEAAAPHVSAVLLERGYLSRAGVGGWAKSPTALILAADDLDQPVGQPAQASTVDLGAAELAITLRAAALKLLVIWLSDAGDEQHARQAAMVASFVELAHAQGMLALVEVIAHGGHRPGERPLSADELLDAAATLGRGADIYKAQVPIQGGDSTADVEGLARDMTATVRVPWVVLSTGVPDARFPELVAASCRGGASGFLAGRAIWSRAVPATTTEETMRALGGSATDLARLARIVDAEARPWMEARR